LIKLLGDKVNTWHIVDVFVSTIFITGTAGSGKSLLTSSLVEWYSSKGSNTISVNLDPGAHSLPYSPDVDIRNYIDIQLIMDSYQMGPNGALILASDMIATRIKEIQEEIFEYNPDYVIIDTAGQMELFAYRPSGPFVVEQIESENKSVLFLFDSTLVSTPINFVSIALLSASLQLRLKTPQVSVLSKCDLVGDSWKKILRWSSNISALEEAISHETNNTDYLLSRRILRSIVRTGFAFELYPVSSATKEGMVDLSAILTRILKMGEEVED
jgi:GTPase SAR1 family protein